MNKNRYSRVTLVLHRSTDEGLSYLSTRLNRSKSELVREVLAEPVELMRELLGKHPEGSELDPRQLALDGLQVVGDLVDEPMSVLREYANG